MAKKNDGAPGIDGVTFAAIEAGGVDDFYLTQVDRMLEKAKEVTRETRNAAASAGRGGVGSGSRRTWVCSRTIG
jgi:hypothetical protein